MPKINLIDCLGAPQCLFFSFIRLKDARNAVVQAEKRRWSYRMAFPNRETSYGAVGGVSRPYRTYTGISPCFGGGNRRGAFPTT
jgi:hypothetical protein